MTARTVPAAALLCLLAAACPAAEAVEALVTQATFPVEHPTPRRKSTWATQIAPKLEGLSEYTTTKVTLQNRYVRVEILPELGGRMIGMQMLPPAGTRDAEPRELFWRHDKITDGVSWSMGGGRISFPHWEHGRHFDETGGYVLRKHADGSATLAVEMRFDPFVIPPETKRYGRATCLRLVQTWTLRPGEARVQWTAKVHNPLPVRYGFKLWCLLRRPGTEGLRYLMPAAGVTGHGATRLSRWDYSLACKDGVKDSLFAVGMKHHWSGWYDPKEDLNVLAVSNRAVAPGCKQVLYPPGGYVEMWLGSHEVFEEPGRLLPAFGSYELPMTLLPAAGIGEAGSANAHLAVRCTPGKAGWDVALAPTTALHGATLAITDGADTQKTTFSADPHKPFSHSYDLAARRVRVTVTDTAGTELFTQVFPLDLSEMPKDKYLRLSARTTANGARMPGGVGLFAEATDLTAEHHYSLPKAQRALQAEAGKAKTVEQALHVARRLIRVERGGASASAAVNKVLAKHAENPHANLYKAILLLEAGEAEQADAHLEKAASLPGGAYLLAHRRIAADLPAQAATLLEGVLDAKPAETFFRPADETAWLLQPGTTVDSIQPRLLLAVALKKQNKLREMGDVLGEVLRRDPACIEAYMLLGDEESVTTLTTRNLTGRQGAELVLEDMQAGRWGGIPKP